MQVNSITSGRTFTYVVPVRVLYEGKSIISYFLHQLNPLLIRGMVNAALQNTATMAVCRHFDTVRSDGVVYKLRGKMSSSTWVTDFRMLYLIVVRG